MKIKLLFTLVFIFTASGLFSQGTWRRVESPFAGSVNRLSMVDSLYGFACADSGVILKTTDGGLSWQKIQTDLSGEIPDIFFLTRNIGWAIGFNLTEPPFGTIVIKTTDGGNSWEKTVLRQEDVFMLEITFHDLLNGWMGGLGGEILRTSDGGYSWDRMSGDSLSFSNFPVMDFRFINDTLAFACGGNIDIAGVIWRSTNSGFYWNATGVGPEPIQKLHVYDSLHIMGVGGDFEYGTAVVRTYDGGLTWDYNQLNIFGVPYGLALRTPNEIWCSLGFAQRFIVSTDSGYTWREILTPDSSSVYDLAFTDSTRGVAVGFGGTLLVYDYNTPVENEPADLPSGFSLSQNYPNPFNPSTVIRFTLPSESNVEITLYDISGRMVKQVLSDVRSAGTHEISLSASGLSSGVYFYKMKAASLINPSDIRTDVKKLTFIK